MLIGYARCSTSSQDLTAQRNALSAAGVDPDAIHVDHGSPAPSATALDWVRPWLRAVTATRSW
ncbi:resolvase [Arthrobacter sp. Hiyo8]|nr:resolvase [Arthrobacter sp. Hiyo8]